MESGHTIIMFEYLAVSWQSPKYFNLSQNIDHSRDIFWVKESYLSSFTFKVACASGHGTHLLTDSMIRLVVAHVQMDTT